MSSNFKKTTKSQKKTTSVLHALAEAVEKIVDGCQPSPPPLKARAQTSQRRPASRATWASRRPTTRAGQEPRPGRLPRLLEPGKKLLIVDDDGEYLELLRRLLAAYACDVEICDSPKFAMAAARARRPDLIILDYKMPGLNGFELVEALRRDEELRAVPRILMTGTSRLLALQDMARWDVHDVLRKPVSRQALVDAAQRALGGALPLRRAEPNTASSLVAQTERGPIEQTRPGLPLSLAAREDESAPAIKAINVVLRLAVSRGASDIHIEPHERSVCVRLRLDGEMVQVLSFPAELGSALAARVKILSNLDIAERRVPQDGRFRFDLEDGVRVEVRVSTLPCQRGEKIVMRVLGVKKIDGDLGALGLSPRDREAVEWALSSPNGLILLTGPTGSGKTTTLYRMISALNTGKRNIVTIEDPIEIELPGVTQVAVNAEVGLTFEKALRAFLRQDPDVMLVGEIRDAETAEIASRAAMTGRLILSTLHTNDAASSVQRLASMGVPSYVLAAALKLVIAQRLVRALCEACRRPDAPTPDERALLQASGVTLDSLYRPTGCAECGGQGYSGRRAVLEVLPLRSAALRAAVAAQASGEALRAAAVKDGMRTLDRAALALVADGQTSLAEALRAASFD